MLLNKQVFARGETLNITAPENSFSNIACTCNSTNFTRGNYTLSALACVTDVDGGVFGSNCTGSNLLVTWAGDLNGNYVVNSADIAVFFTGFINYENCGILNPDVDYDHDLDVDNIDQTLFNLAYQYYYYPH